MRAPHRSTSAVDPRTGALPGDDVSAPPMVAPPDPDQTPREFVDALVKEHADAEIRRLKRLHGRVRTPDGKLRRARFIGAVLGLRFEKFTAAEIAAILGVSSAQVQSALRAVRKDADISEQLKRIDDQVVPIAVDNLMRAVTEGDMRATMKLLEGRGLFRTHKSIDAQVTERRIDIRLTVQRPAHMPPDTPLPGVKAGTIATGTPSGYLPDITVEPVKESA